MEQINKLVEVLKQIDNPIAIKVLADYNDYLEKEKKSMRNCYEIIKIDDSNVLVIGKTYNIDPWINFVVEDLEGFKFRNFSVYFDLLLKNGPYNRFFLSRTDSNCKLDLSKFQHYSHLYEPVVNASRKYFKSHPELYDKPL